MVHTTQRLRDRAKAMRHEPTTAEQRVWRWLRDRRFGNYKFKRQVPNGGYILDFYCAELKLAIEVDGRQHEELWMCEYDGERTARLRARGIEVLRISNEVVMHDQLTAVECIQWAIDARR